MDSKVKDITEISININNVNEKGTACVSGSCAKNDGTLSSSVQLSSTSFSCSDEVTTSLTTPPDGGWGWMVVFASCMISLIADGVSLSFGILFVDLGQYFGESKAKTSWVGSIFLSMPLLAGPIASYLSDRYGCRKVCIIGALLSAAGFILSVFANSIEVLLLTFSLSGLGLALCYVTSIVIVAYYFEKRRSLATGLSACGTGIGTFGFPPLTIYLLEQYAWRGTLLILSGFFLNIIVFGALMRDLEFPSKSCSSIDKNLGSGSENLLEDSERLCSSLVQLPTYLECDSLPEEVMSELSTREGGYLSSLLEQHPYLLNSIITSNEKDSMPAVKDFAPECAALVQNSKKKIKSRQQKCNVQKSCPSQIQKDLSCSMKLDAAYLCNMRFQRGSITYRGAMLNIRRYRVRASSCPDIYKNSMVTISEEKTCLFFQDLKELLLDMFDLSIFKNIQYTIFCISNFILYACVDVPYVYLPDHAVHLGYDLDTACFLISVLGVLNTFGLIIVGYIGDKPWVDSSLLYSLFIAISGLMLALIPVVHQYYGLASLVGIYGFTISANYTLVPVIIVNLISLECFAGAYGLLLLVQGIASLIGPPLAGMLFDMTGNYDVTFFCTGICIFISGAMVVPVAKTLLCKKASLSTASSKESVKHNSHAGKVCFEETAKFMEGNAPKKPSSSEILPYALTVENPSGSYNNTAENNENPINASGQCVVCNNDAEITESSKLVRQSKHNKCSIYENPFPDED